MSKRLFPLLVASLLGALQAAGNDIEAARKVIDNFAKNTALPIELTLTSPNAATKQYQVTVADNMIKISGSSGVALCRGFYDLAKSQGWGLYSWSGNTFNPAKAQKLPASYSKGMKSPFAHHYYFNVVTYGYTMPYWDWKRWSREIDWMALHGFDMPLALVAQEAIMTRVFKKLGIPDADINGYFAGPAHLPWMRMGNLFGIDGPLTDSWHKEQIALQHKVLKKMRALGMKPICPGFAGFVPEGIKKVYPDTKLNRQTWAGGAFHAYMMTPENELFAKIGTMFVQEWEKEFGKGQYYLVDSFNEIDSPFPPGSDKFLNDYGKVIYKSIKDANPDATWVMQGWMLGYQPNIWTPEALSALTKYVPDDKLLILDLATDYNKHFWRRAYNWDRYKGYFNKQWVYSTVPNMGGKTGHTGVLNFYANGVWDALNSPNKGKLVGYGTAPEGIENNEVIYELIADAGWQEKPIDVPAWLRNYNVNRYGKSTPTLERFWTLMMHNNSVYGPQFKDHPRFNWQMGPNGGTSNWMIVVSKEYDMAIKTFLSEADDFAKNAAYRHDLVELAVMYACGKAQQLTFAINQNISAGKLDEAKKQIGQFRTLMQRIDDLLAYHPLHRLDKWLDHAKAYDKKIPKKGTSYESNARRLVTIWGPPINDYSARIWSGLVAGYYLKRWEMFFENRMGAKHNIGAWERDWVAGKVPFKSKAPKGNSVTLARELVAFADSAVGGGDQSNPDLVAVFTGKELSDDKSERRITLSMARIKEASSLLVTVEKGKLALGNCSLILDGRKIALKAKQLKNNVVQLTWSIPADATANNECALLMNFTSPSPAWGQVKMLWKNK